MWTSANELPPGYHRQPSLSPTEQITCPKVYKPKQLLILGCLLIFPLLACAGENFWSPQVPEQRLALGTLNPFYAPNEVGVTVDYSLSPDWSVACLHLFSQHTTWDFPLAPTADPGTAEAPPVPGPNDRSVGEVSAGGFDVIELRRRFSHQNIRTMRSQKRLEYYGAIGVMLFHGYQWRGTQSAEKLKIYNAVYENSNYTAEIELPPFQSLAVGAGASLYLLGAGFVSFGFSYTGRDRVATYKVSSTDPKVSQQEMELEVGTTSWELLHPRGSYLYTRLVVGYAF